MNSTTIKILAITTMLIDHVGIFFFPHILVFRIIGRVSFPLFAWLVANGAIHTKNIDNYLLRLFLFGLVSQMPYSLALSTIEGVIAPLNVLFTLFLGLLCIKIYRGAYSQLIKSLLIISIVILGQVIGSDYGSIGILSILFFYIFTNNFAASFTSQVIIYTLFWYGLLLVTNTQVTILHLIQPTALFSLMPIFLYNNKYGLNLRNIFYFIYPIQFLVFYILKIWL